jgi:hypothetical protein
MSTLLKPAPRKRQIVGWRQAQREKAAILHHKRVAARPKPPR